jgi:hypothetical protein
MGSIKEFKYKLIKNFLTEEEIPLLKRYCIINHRNNRINFDFRQNNNGETFFYGDPLMESLMVNKLSLMEKETGLKLFPTYAFWRMYTMFSHLGKHKDRPSCEVSVTVMIGSDETKWPIFMEGNPIELSPGDAVIYLGCDLTHWREEFNGDWHAQCFLHYVDQNGPYKDAKLDCRPNLGASDSTVDWNKMPKLIK